MTEGVAHVGGAHGILRSVLAASERVVTACRRGCDVADAGPGRQECRRDGVIRSETTGTMASPTRARCGWSTPWLGVFARQGRLRSTCGTRRRRVPMFVQVFQAKGSRRRSVDTPGCEKRAGAVGPGLAVHVGVVVADRVDCDERFVSMPSASSRGGVERLLPSGVHRGGLGEDAVEVERAPLHPAGQAERPGVVVSPVRHGRGGARAGRAGAVARRSAASDLTRRVSGRRRDRGTGRQAASPGR